MRCVALGLMAVVAAGCAEPPVQRPTSVEVLHSKEVSGRVVLYLHGAGGSARELTTDPAKKPLVQRLLANGYTLVSASAGGDSWGNGMSVRAYRSVLHEVESRQEVRGVYILAQSMGGLAGWQLTDLPKLRAWAGIYPVCNLASVYRLRTYAAQIRKAFGEHLADALRRLSHPVFKRPLPVILWASPRDRVVPKSQNADECAAAARAAGGAVREIATSGDHGDRSNFDATTLVAFFNDA